MGVRREKGRDRSSPVDEGDDLMHDDASLMIPPPGFKFIPRFETVCGKPGCFECFDIYCERCESKDRRIVELEMRNNDLVKYITQLQGRIFGRTQQGPGGVTSPQQTHLRHSQDLPGSSNVAPFPFAPSTASQAERPAASTADPFAYIQSPVLYDPNMNVSYVATTTFAPAPHDVPYSKSSVQKQ